MMTNFEIRKHYNKNWSDEQIENAIEKIEKLRDRTLKYRDRYKKKTLTIEDGCLNNWFEGCILTEEYELQFYMIDRDYIYTINLEDIINKDYVFKYDRKYHTLALA